MIPKYDDACIALVKESEGYAYPPSPDPIGISTVYWGHRVRHGETFDGTAEQAESVLAADLDAAWSVVADNVTQELSQGQVNACTDFVFNEGPGEPGVKDGFVWLKNGHHSSLLLQINLGNFNAAADQFLLWDKAGGQVLAGLQTRREKERALFLA